MFVPNPDISVHGATFGPEGSSLPERKLDSWKEIAAFLHRQVRTVQRWEQSEGLPVRRHEHASKSSVYAYASELERWLKNRQPKNIAAPQRQSPQLASGKVRLVVLPFANLSGDPQQDYFSAGLTTEMIVRLGKLDPAHLGVIAAATSSGLAGKPIAEVGRALDVGYALEGSVRRNAQRIRIDVQLIQVSDQTHLWADSYDRDLGDILSVQDDVGAAVAAQIRLALTPLAAPAAPKKSNRTVNPEAYDDYLRGRFYSTNRTDLRKALRSYEQAIRKDPQYALAYAGLASTYTLLGQVPYDDTPPTEVKPKAKEAAEHALRLAPQLGEAHAVLGNVAFNYYWDFETAEREFQRALALTPNDPTPHVWYSHYCVARNRAAEALEESSQILELDPVSPLFNSVLAETHYYTRNFNATLEQARRAIEQFPTYPLAYLWLGSAYREKKKYAQALAEFSKARQFSGNHPAMTSLYGHALAASGNLAGAHKTLSELRRLASSRYVSPLYFAAVHTGLGEKDQALEWLERAYHQRTDRLVYLGVDPIADPLRAVPRFKELLRKIGVAR